MTTSTTTSMTTSTTTSMTTSTTTASRRLFDPTRICLMHFYFLLFHVRSYVPPNKVYVFSLISGEYTRENERRAQNLPPQQRRGGKLDKPLSFFSTFYYSLSLSLSLTIFSIRGKSYERYTIVINKSRVEIYYCNFLVRYDSNLRS